MLTSVQEHHQLHRFLLTSEYESTVTIIVLLECVQFVNKHFQIRYLLIVPGVRVSAIHNVSEQNSLQVKYFLDFQREIALYLLL